MVNPDIFAARRERLRQLLRQRELDALLVSFSANRYYLSGFELHNPQENESAGMLLIQADGKDILYTDPRYRDMALRLWPEEGLCIYAGNAAEIIGASIGHEMHGTLGLEAQTLPLATYDALFASLPSSISICRASGLVENLRIIKSADELRRMQAACDLNHVMMRWLPSVLTPGRTELSVAWDVEKFFREHGASELAFPTIVGRGPNAALPHCIPSGDILRQDDLVLVDAGCRLEEYCSDQTRTFWLGDTPSTRFAETLEAVQEAQRRAIAILRPGLPCNEAFQIAWEHFEALGVAASFTHGLGHGVGLETHEMPSLGRNCKIPLQEGMVVTVEPGLYDPEWGGIRWEYMVVITQDGCRVM